MMRKYEAIVMFYPNVEEEKRQKVLDRLKGILDQDGKVTNVDEWGNRKLAYLIEYHEDAYYVLLEFEAETKAITEFDRVAKILDPVMRHMVVRLED